MYQVYKYYGSGGCPNGYVLVIFQKGISDNENKMELISWSHEKVTHHKIDHKNKPRDLQWLWSEELLCQSKADKAIGELETFYVKNLDGISWLSVGEILESIKNFSYRKFKVKTKTKPIIKKRYVYKTY